MKVTLVTDQARIKVKVAENGEFAESSEHRCPHCMEKPLRVRGTGKRISSFDTYSATAICYSCRREIGTLESKMKTLFGLEEDERVFRSGVTIY